VYHIGIEVAFVCRIVCEVAFEYHIDRERVVYLIGSEVAFVCHIYREHVLCIL